MKLIKPDIAGINESLSLSFCAGHEIVGNTKITDDGLAATDFSGVSFEKVIFDKCRFSDADFSKCTFTDVVFNSCDLSNCDFSSSYFARCEMLAVKGVGANMSRCFLGHTFCENSNFRYANFDTAKFDKFVFAHCDLSEAFLSNCTFKVIEFDETELNRTNISHTSFNGIDLSTCNLQALVVSAGAHELRGMVVNMFQAADLAKLLGITIK